MKVRFYGKLADVLGRERDIEVHTPCTITELRVLLAADHPEAAETLLHHRVRACFGDTIVRDSDVIPDGEVLELLAPVSGG